MGTLFALVHAPNLGPASWEPVARQLAAAGCAATVPSLAGFADAGPPYTGRLVDLAARQIRAGGRDDVVLVVHSGAGVFAPYLAEEIKAREVRVLFADATIPSGLPGAQVVSPGSAAFLRELTTDGMVAPWPKWWRPEDVAALFPDEAICQTVCEEASALPLDFFEEGLPPVPGSWPKSRPGYLCFSKPYRQEAGEASRLGWQVRHLPGGHLHMVVNPGEVAAAITALASGQVG